MSTPTTDASKPGPTFTPAQLVPNALLRTPAVCTVTGMARPTLYQAMAEGLFPRPIKLGEKSSAWPASEVNAVLAARIAGRSNDEIRELVTELTAARKLRV
ncbi:helix-turn-helix transcriptional regulator [Salipiger abyssi]|uniref:helix-turn-helix transcriptional regulator n=1 Tax=Salipiger abyssi TaxID=1250539 RepID=UPI001A8DC0D3|nr:AlpA family transcriptional regulator [Salipiger abyssi]MBN9889683.1 AlpA family transcriptional regulator [Salipiger abyssi]